MLGSNEGVLLSVTLGVWVGKSEKIHDEVGSRNQKNCDPRNVHARDCPEKT